MRGQAQHLGDEAPLTETSAASMSALPSRRLPGSEFPSSLEGKSIHGEPRTRRSETTCPSATAEDGEGREYRLRRVETGGQTAALPGQKSEVR